MPWTDIAAAFRDQFGVNGFVAMRLAHGWSQRDAAEHWNRNWPKDTKTFKNFSYWENWAGPAGYAPSLSVLAKLAELYQCGVTDLVADLGDHRCLDINHESARYDVSRVTMQRALSVALEGALSRLADASVDEVAAAGLLWANKLEPTDSPYGLLMKLSAGLGLAAASHTGPTAVPPPPAPTTHELVGIWRSRHWGGGDGDYVIVLSGSRGRLAGHSLPHPAGLKLRLYLEQEGSQVTGTWVERSPSGRMTHGVVRLLADGTRRLLHGQWLAFGHRFHAIGGDWELTWQEEHASGSVLLTHRAAR